MMNGKGTATKDEASAESFVADLVPAQHDNMEKINDEYLLKKSKKNKKNSRKIDNFLFSRTGLGLCDIRSYDYDRTDITDITDMDRYVPI